jgi:hypothetical protein
MAMRREHKVVDQRREQEVVVGWVRDTLPAAP